MRRREEKNMRWSLRDERMEDKNEKKTGNGIQKMTGRSVKGTVH